MVPALESTKVRMVVIKLAAAVVTGAAVPCPYAYPHPELRKSVFVAELRSAAAVPGAIPRVAPAVSAP